jgi:hypothetical protein
MRMTTIQPKGETVRQVIKWISERRTQEKGASFSRLIEEGAARFNLSPKEETFLRSFYEQEED